jgi:hypothetical protein
MADIPFAGTNAQDLANQLADSLLNYHAPWLYLAQGQFGVAVNTGWEIEWDTLEYSGNSEAILHYAWVGGNRVSIAPPSPPAIPGYSSLVLVIFSLLSVTGLIYIVNKKRRIN